MFKIIYSCITATALTVASQAWGADTGGQLARDGGTESFMRSLNVASQQEQRSATGASQRELDGMPLEKLLRSRTVALDPIQIFATEVIELIANIQNDQVTHYPVLLDSEGATIEPVPAGHITLSPFPEITYVVENTGFSVEPQGYVWQGKIVNGGRGAVTVFHIRPYDICNIIINSDLGQFNVLFTDTPPYHVVIEANPTVPVVLD